MHMLGELSRDKKKRKVMFLLEKLGVFGKLDSRVRIAACGCDCNTKKEKCREVPSSVNLCW
jgi:hypothetical protein